MRNICVDHYGLEPQHTEFTNFMNKHCSEWSSNDRIYQSPLSTVCGHGPECGVRWIFTMTVNANTPCHFTRGLDHGCKMFEFTNIARSMRSRTLVAMFVSSRKCISLY